MKYVGFLFLYVLFFGLASSSAHELYAQDRNPVGSWHGDLAVGAQTLKVVVHIKRDGDVFSATMDSPDQKAFGIPVSEISFTNDTLSLRIAAAGMSFKGVLNAQQQIVGKFMQGGASLDLILERMSELQIQEKPKSSERPQVPEFPLPYRSKEVRFENPDLGISLAGTLTLPEGDGPFPAAILVTGSGPQNRNSEVFGHQPFLILSDYLTRQGIAVLRYDDRGVGESEGVHDGATSRDFADDVLGAFEFLRQEPAIDKKRIGIVGHSEGGLIAQIAAHDDDRVAFVVMMAAPGMAIDRLMYVQNKQVMESQGLDPAVIESELKFVEQVYAVLKNEGIDDAPLRDSIVRMYETKFVKAGLTPANASVAARSSAAQLTSPWFTYFIRFQPAEYLQGIKCPVLAINGQLDIQVAPDNLKAIESVLGNAGTSVTTIFYDDKNHLLQTAKTGAVDEYAQISETISPEVLKDIGDWIRKITEK